MVENDGDGDCSWDFVNSFLVGDSLYMIPHTVTLASSNEWKASGLNYTYPEDENDTFLQNVSNQPPTIPHIVTTQMAISDIFTDVKTSNHRK
jgi:hypothetical protein